MKGEPQPLNPALFWREVPLNPTTFYAVNENGELVTALTDGESKGFIKNDGNIFLAHPFVSGAVEQWGKDETAVKEGDDTLVYRGVSYVLADNVITPTIEDYQP